MNEPARAPKPDHPLMADRSRLEKITDNMYALIQKMIYRGQVPPDLERVLHGGESADDVLQEALIALLGYDPDDLRESWEALSVGIARNKALAALRRATKGRRAAGAGPDAPDDVTVVSLDAAAVDPPDDSEDSDPEKTFMKTQQALVLLRLARERLSDRERIVYFGIQFQGRTRTAIAARLGVTPQAVSQMYPKIAKKLHAAACQDPEFPTTAGTTERRTP